MEVGLFFTASSFASPMVEVSQVIGGTNGKMADLSTRTPLNAADLSGPLQVEGARSNKATPHPAEQGNTNPMSTIRTGQVNRGRVQTKQGLFRGHFKEIGEHKRTESEILVDGTQSTGSLGTAPQERQDYAVSNHCRSRFYALDPRGVQRNRSR